jgi:hypothetical protein
MSAGAGAEDFENQPGPVNDFRVPGPLEIALLYRRQRGVDDNNGYFLRLDEAGQAVDRALAEERGRTDFCRPYRFRMDDIEVDCLGEANRFLQAQFGVARILPVYNNGVKDECAPRTGRYVT